MGGRGTCLRSSTMGRLMHKKYPGTFIVVDGPDGAGKSTLTKALGGKLRESGCEVVELRDPGSTEISEAARELVLSSKFDIGPAAELFLYLTARAELVEKEIVPALERGAVVVCDRFELSTLVYQADGRGLPPEEVAAANSLATGGLSPNITIVLDVSLDMGMERLANSGKAADRLESASVGMRGKVCESFRLVKGDGIFHVDASGTAEEVLDEAWKTIFRESSIGKNA